MKRYDLRHLHDDFYDRMVELIESDLKVSEVGIFLFEVGDFSSIQESADVIKDQGHDLMNSLKFNEVDWTIVVKKVDNETKKARQEAKIAAAQLAEKEKQEAEEKAAAQKVAAQKATKEKEEAEAKAASEKEAVEKAAKEKADKEAAEAKASKEKEEAEAKAVAEELARKEEAEAKAEKEVEEKTVDTPIGDSEESNKKVAPKTTTKRPVRPRARSKSRAKAK